MTFVCRERIPLPRCAVHVFWPSLQTKSPPFIPSFPFFSQGSILLIDEAHNLADAVASAAGAELTQRQAEAAHADLSAYLARFGQQVREIGCREPLM